MKEPALLRIIENTYVESLGNHSDGWQAKNPMIQKEIDEGACS
jgi:hypothetical protein